MEAPWSGNTETTGDRSSLHQQAPAIENAGWGLFLGFHAPVGRPIHSVRCVAGPTPPRASNALKEVAWQLISHLALNYLSLADKDEEQGSAALRQIMSLYGDNSDPAIRKQVDGVVSISSKPVVRRIDYAQRRKAPIPDNFRQGAGNDGFAGRIGISRERRISLGAVLEQFFRKYVSINSFTETVDNEPGTWGNNAMAGEDREQTQHLRPLIAELGQDAS